ncbi:acyltransferase family protein [Planctomicrobium sp. SH527]|uniref:acyltransferase family protein n=1 Tax=Planctomicrobium sp. SH527 TaxID=3448123 RepID=UPI003F5CB075
MTNKRLVYLDGIRGMSAIVVCAGHLRAATYRDFSEIENPTFLESMFYFGTSLGHQAVMVFFVLSGFFVGGAVLRAGQNFQWTSYLIARLSRLWAVLLPALVFTVLIDAVITEFFPEVLSGHYRERWNSGPTAGLDGYSSSSLIFLGNLFFLQTIAVPVFGTNGPLWSLANEFWYYIAFPVLAIILGLAGSPGGKYSKLLYAVGFSLFFLLPHNIVHRFCVFLMGVLAYSVSQRFEFKKRYGLLFVSLFLFAISLIYSKSIRLQLMLNISSEFMIGLAFALLCTVLARWPNPDETSLGKAVTTVLTKLSDLSYSLYLMHFPLVVLIAASFYHSESMKFSLSEFGVFTSLLTFLVALSWVFWAVFERQTPIVKRLFEKLRNSASR